MRTALAFVRIWLIQESLQNHHRRDPIHRARFALRHEAFLTPAVNPWPDSELSALQNGKTKNENAALHGGDCARQAHNQPKY